MFPKLINFSQKIFLPLSRFAIFLVYFWFGILKVMGASPATPMVLALLNKTMPFFPPDKFLVLFGLFEALIGVLFLIPRLTFLAFTLLVIHLVTTVMPLFILPKFVWMGFLIPTLEGQYVIKNILIISLGFVIIANFKSGGVWRSPTRERSGEL